MDWKTTGSRIDAVLANIDLDVRLIANALIEGMITSEKPTNEMVRRFTHR